MWPYSLFHNKRLKLNKIYPLYSTLLHIFYFLLITFRRGIPAKFFVPSLYHLPAISRKAGLKLTHLVYFWLNQGISGGVENLKSINHKVHKGLTHRSQRTILQGFGFVHFVPFLPTESANWRRRWTLCALWLKRSLVNLNLHPNQLSPVKWEMSQKIMKLSK